MNLRHIAPTIARWCVIPAVLALVALGGFILTIPFRSNNKDAVWIAFLMAAGVATFFFYIAYRGVVLIRFRNVRAELVEDGLLIDDKGREKIHHVDFLEVCDFSSMQIVEVREKASGIKLLAVDYYYPFGMELVRQLQRRIGEQAGSSNGG
jgi:hypothetical protein